MMLLYKQKGGDELKNADIENLLALLETGLKSDNIYKVTITIKPNKRN